MRVAYVDKGTESRIEFLAHGGGVSPDKRALGGRTEEDGRKAVEEKLKAVEEKLKAES
jgi:hypothetical protein